MRARAKTIHIPTEYEVSLKRSESPQELTVRLEQEKAESTHRLELEKAEADYRRRRDLLITWAGVVSVVTILVGCLVVALSPGGSGEDKTWAKSILIAIVTGFLGFLSGRHVPAQQTAESKN